MILQCPKFDCIYLDMFFFTYFPPKKYELPSLPENDGTSRVNVSFTKAPPLRFVGLDTKGTPADLETVKDDAIGGITDPASIPGRIKERAGTIASKLPNLPSVRFSSGNVLSLNVFNITVLKSGGCCTIVALLSVVALLECSVTTSKVHIAGAPFFIRQTAMVRCLLMVDKPCCWFLVFYSVID
jgi:hypothetical protein